MSFIIHNVGVVRGARRVLWRVAVGILVASMLFVAGLGILPASADPGDAVSDSSFSLDPANTIARAIWSDGTTMWVVDLSGRLFAYTLATGARDTGAEITTLKNKGNKNANGMWSDGTTIWVSDDNDDKIYAYDLASGVYRSNKQIAPLHSNNDHGKGLWSDGTTIWVADHDDDKLYAYDLASGGRRSGSDINDLWDAGNGRAAGLWSDGETMWVVDDADAKIYAYDLDSGDRQSELDFNSLDGAGNDSPKGLWSDGATMWVSDNDDNKIYAYEMPADSALSSLELSDVNLGNFSPSILNYYVNVPNTVSQTTVDAEPVDSDASVTILPADADTNTAGHQVDIGSATTTVTVTVTVGTDVSTYAVEITKVDAAVLSDDSSLSSLELSGIDIGFSSTTTHYNQLVDSTVDSTTLSYTRGDETAAVSITPGDADGVTAGHQVDLGIGLNTITVALKSSDGTSNTSYVVKVTRDSDAAFARISSEEYPTLGPAHRSEPVDLWSNGTTTWISEADERKIFAYDAVTKARDSAKDIDWLDPVTGYSIGIWSDGTIFWVSDWADDNIYPYVHASETLILADTIALDSVDALPRNGSPRSIWSDGETMWVAERTGSHVFAYDVATGDRDASKEIAVAATPNDEPRGLWSNGVTMWVSDDEDDKIYAYTLATGARASALDFNTLIDAGNKKPSGIWSDGVTMWVLDEQDKKVYAYNMPQNALLDSLEMSDVVLSEFDPAATNVAGRVASTVSSTTVTTSTHSDGSTIVISPVDSDANTDGHQVVLGTGDTTVAITVTNGSKVQTYTVVVTKIAATSLSSDATLSSLALSGVDFGVFAAETVSYNVDVDNSVSSTVLTYASADSAAVVTINPTDADANAAGYQINLAEGSNAITVSVTATDGITTQLYTVIVKRASSLTFGWDELPSSENLDPANGKARAIWSDGTAMWVGELGGALFAYNLADLSRDAAKDVTTLAAADNRKVNGLWSDGETIWVSNEGHNTIYAYDLATGARSHSDQFGTLFDAGNRNARGLWSDGTIMWVGDPTDDKIYAYNLIDGSRQQNKDINNLNDSGNVRAAGLWSNGTVIWVADDSADKIFAYDLATGDRMADLDIDELQGMGNNSPKGLWSNGTIMWVTDPVDDKLYAYELPTQ